MAQKQPMSINFSQGIDTKSDPKQVQVGRFLSLVNSIFDELGALKKRNGFQQLSQLPFPATTAATFNGDLVALGTSLISTNPTLQALSSRTQQWASQGFIQPASITTLPLIQNSLNQTQSDSAVGPNGLVCVVWSEYNGSSTAYKYAVLDSATGQKAVAPTAIPVASGTVTGSPRVFVLGNYFIVVFTNVITATSHLQYIAVSCLNPTVRTSNADIASSYISATTLSWDGVVVGSNLYIAYNTTTGGQSIKITYLSVGSASAGGGPVTPVTYAGSIATMMSLSADISSPQSPVIYAAFYDAAGSTGNVVAVDQNLNKRMTATQYVVATTVYNVTCLAGIGNIRVIYEVSNNYSYDAAIATHFVNTVVVTLPATLTTGAVGSTDKVGRSLGLASKAFAIGQSMYVLTEYQSGFQPTYFLVRITTDSSDFPSVIAKLSYQNGYVNASNASQGYLPTGLPSVTVSGSTATFSYLEKDLIEAISKGNTGTASTALNPIQTSNVYTQTGIKQASITLGPTLIDTAEIGANLNIGVGFLAAYDGTQETEQNFFIYPDSIECVWSATGGSIHAQPDGATNTNAYWYQVTYEWTDNQGNVQRSAPSIPVAVTTTASGTAGSITVNIPYLRITYKSNVKIVIYRWSVAQQVYYQVTSVTQPTLSVTTADSIAYVDTLADASILGGNILYTTGGVVENVNAPSSSLMTLFDDRLWLVDAEDQNLLWYSKQVIEATPVEMSDLFTFYIAPTTGAQGSTGVISALSVMDDKLILFKKDAIYYLNGSGPDNTGANSQYTGPVFITSTVGCSIQSSIVFTPNGLMFQSDKGIWLLGRDLSVQYIGAPVEAFTLNGTVESAIGIPGTNQVRFTMSQGVTLLFDYFVGQWGTFVGVPGLSSTLYGGTAPMKLHTYIDQYGRVFQENPGVYLDGSTPVLMSFKTGWIGLGGLRGYQRFYEFYLTGEYLSPHKLYIQTAYDFGFPEHQSVFSPRNYQPPYGGAPLYGDGPYGGSAVESFRVHTKKQLCKTFQISVEEIFDASFGAMAGGGVTLSGMTLVVALKRGWNPVPGAQSVG